MYICKKCKYRFKEPHTTIGSGDCWDTCPNCGSEDYRELKYKELKLEDKTLEQRVQDIEKILKIRKKIDY